MCDQLDSGHWLRMKTFEGKTSYILGPLILFGIDNYKSKKVLKFNAS